MSWQIENDLRDRVALSWLSLTGVTVRGTLPGLSREIDERAEQLRAAYADPASAGPALAAARRLYHGLGIDPSKHRPSSEALLRRILQGKGLYQVNTAVDAANLTSVTHLRPVGLYDADRIEPDRIAAGDGPGLLDQVRLRLGRPGEEYPGIGKEMIHLWDRPALFDLSGPFGNPSADSDRTKVTLETRRLLFVIFEPPDETPEGMDAHLSLSQEILLRHLGGQLEA